MSETIKQKPVFGREAVMSALNEQLSNVAGRVQSDLTKIKNFNKHPEIPPAVFLIYQLWSMEHKPLSEKYLADFDINFNAVEKSDNFKKIKQFCDMQELNVFLDYYMNYSGQDAPRLIRLVVDGWD